MTGYCCSQLQIGWMSSIAAFMGFPLLWRIIKFQEVVSNFSTVRDEVHLLRGTGMYFTAISTRSQALIGK